jgi:nucleoside phosphorylase
MINIIKEYLMTKYCPKYVESMPIENDNLSYQCEAIILYGYWGHKEKIVYTKVAIGKINAYKTARWLALKAQFYRPKFFFDCGINYGYYKVID